MGAPLRKSAITAYGYPTCPKVHMVKRQWACGCKESCSTTKKGCTTYTYENMVFRMFPGIQRDSNERFSRYKIRTTVERPSTISKSACVLPGGSSETTQQPRQMSSLLESPASWPPLLHTAWAVHSIAGA